MRYRVLGNTGLLVSEIALGTVELGMDYGFKGSAHYARPGVEEAEALLQAAVEAGINLLDTARAYGEAEAIIGRVLPRLNPRPYVTTKFVADGTMTDLEERIVSSVETSLKLLGLERVELLQVHNLTPGLLEREEFFQAVERLQEEGKVAHVGASLYGVEVAQRAVQCVPLRTVQAPFNFLDARMAPAFGAAQARGMGVLVRSAFLRGVLTSNVHQTPPELSALRDAALAAAAELGWDVERLAELALRFCLSSDSVSTVLIGVRSVAELQANVRAAEAGALDADTLTVLAKYRIDDDRLVSPTHWAGLI